MQTIVTVVVAAQSRTQKTVDQSHDISFDSKLFESIDSDEPNPWSGTELSKTRIRLECMLA
ncbi:hypothetical protein GCM10009007_18360 [Formosimonas limnophila]|uniref:Uncharacterized protein n=1 Tax=Formosimonas limnophila TaxID=1384487 RepID=A0A8J3CMB8_9BURK|nr:hypothetical protein GCM10009007_18360 [Formosimonas limnophila]